eukprot:scaffold179326_cov17-Tisochrysis_lutea.AAC.2
MRRAHAQVCCRLGGGSKIVMRSRQHAFALCAQGIPCWHSVVCSELLAGNGCFMNRCEGKSTAVLICTLGSMPNS